VSKQARFANRTRGDTGPVYIQIHRPARLPSLTYATSVSTPHCYHADYQRHLPTFRSSFYNEPGLVDGRQVPRGLSCHVFSMSWMIIAWAAQIFRLAIPHAMLLRALSCNHSGHVWGGARRVDKFGMGVWGGWEVMGKVR
jgi:hypothetical protein